MDRPSTSADESDSKATRAGTAETVASLSARFSAPLRRFFAKRRIPRDDVDDLVQDVFVRLASRPNLGATERLDAYLFTTAANLLNDRRRRQISRAANAHESFDEDLHGDLLDATGPERTLLATQTVAKLIEALYELRNGLARCLSCITSKTIPMPKSRGS